jgi:hypothetical protein
MAWNDHYERMRARIHRRAFAYRALFVAGQGAIDQEPWWAFWRRPSGGDLGPAALIVLEDLRRYCYADKSLLKVGSDGHVDALQMAFADGRRDVYNRIQAMANLTSDQVDAIAAARSNGHD